MKKTSTKAKPEIPTYIDNAPMYLFNNGTNYESYKMLGAHKSLSFEGKTGYLFAVWAPNAKTVSVVCDQNGWDRNLGRMHKHIASGIWEVFIEGVTPGQCYKFSIETFRGSIELKSDPYAFLSEVR
ncbi:MAG: 1,4-alpha-glucan branching enzyme, partial [Oscillospiraceae bacterium]